MIALYRRNQCLAWLLAGYALVGLVRGPADVAWWVQALVCGAGGFFARWQDTRNRRDRDETAWLHTCRICR